MSTNYGHVREVFPVHVHIPSYVERELPVKRDVVQPSQAPQTSHPRQVVLVSANEVKVHIDTSLILRQSPWA